jgi:hypothetical protein
MSAMKSLHLVSTALGGLVLLGSLTGTATVAKADTASTIAIAAGAAAIVGALLTDNSGRSYYVRDNQRHYVDHNTAVYYRSRHGNGYNNGNHYGQMNRGNMGHGNMDRGDMDHGNIRHDDHRDNR